MIRYAVVGTSPISRQFVRATIDQGQWTLRGALVDLRVLALYAAVDWFGMPVDACYYARLLDPGADAEGVPLLGYPDFDVSLAVSKVHSSFQDNEVYGSGGRVLAFNSVAAAERLSLWQRGRGDIAIPLAPLAQNPLSPEVAHFTQRLLAYPAEPHEAPYTYDRLRQLGADVIALSERLRRDAGVAFPADPAFGERG